MSLTTVTEPTYILPGKPAEITLTVDTGNFVKVVLTSAPKDSIWAKKLIDEDLNEVQLWEIEAGQKKRFTFDVPGVFVISVREFTKGGVTFGGDYLDDPSGIPDETWIANWSSTIQVGQKMTADIQINSEVGTLSFWVWGTTIRATTIPVHGEATPIFVGDTPKMKTAAETSAVKVAVAALAGQAASTIASSLATVADDLIGKFDAHIVKTTGSTHASADTVNGIGTTYLGATTLEALGETYNLISSKMRAHYTNDTGTGVGTANWHTYADWDNLPLLTGIGNSVLGASLALASAWHSYETHRIDVSNVHGGTDTTNILTTLAPLYSVYQKIIAVLQTDNPTAPATDNSGATILVHRAGMTKA